MRAGRTLTFLTVIAIAMVTVHSEVDAADSLRVGTVVGNGRDRYKLLKVLNPPPSTKMLQLLSSAQRMRNRNRNRNRNPHDDYTISETKLGAGVFGTVYLAQRIKDKLNVAIKFMANTASNKNEVDVHHQIYEKCKDYVIQPLGSWIDAASNKLALVSELADCDLLAYSDPRQQNNCNKNKKTEENAVYLLGKARKLPKIWEQIIKGVECLHKNDVVHRDIRAVNLLVLQDKPVIADFGFSRTKTQVDESAPQPLPAQASRFFLPLEWDDRCRYDAYATALTLIETYTAKHISDLMKINLISDKKQQTNHIATTFTNFGMWSMLAFAKTLDKEAKELLRSLLEDRSLSKAEKLLPGLKFQSYDESTAVVNPTNDGYDNVN